MSLHNAEHIHAAIAQTGRTVADLIAQYGTPFYLYDASVIRQQYRAVENAFAQVELQDRVHIHYAVKANDRLGILRIFAEMGAGADLVAIGEHYKAEQSGIPAQKQVFSGVGKTRPEIISALKNTIGQINVESLPELQMIIEHAKELGITAKVAFRLNPDTRAGGHDNISTGAAEHKFGLSLKDAATALRIAQDSAYLQAVGVTVHIGSQITEARPYIEAFERLNSFLDSQNFEPEVIDLGGGFGIDYETGEPAFDLTEYAKAVKSAFGHRPAMLYLEIGRYLVAQSGILIFRTLFEKQAAHNRWIIGDMAMNDLMRPALYQAHHRMSILSNISGATSPTHIAGPICESTDKLQHSYDLPHCPEGTILALHDTGAYGSVMAMGYNSRRLPPEIIIDGQDIRTLRRPISTEDLLLFEK